MGTHPDGNDSTVRGLSARLAALSPEKRALLEQRLRSEAPKAVHDRIHRRHGTNRPPLSFAQQRLWFLEQLETGHAFYNLPLVTRLPGPIATTTLERALNEVVRRHESLRTTFVLDDGVPMQDVAVELKLTLETTDLRSVPGQDREAEAGRRATAEALRPFDLQQGPLIRAHLLSIHPGDHLLVVTMHHIISDGWSLDIFAREIKYFYRAFLNGEPATLPPPSMQYGDFAIWQRDHLSGATLDRLLAYWKQKLDGMPALLELPTDGPRPRVQTFDGGSFLQPYAKLAIESLQALAAREQATLFVALLAVFEVLLHRFSGITDMVVGSPIANRQRVELEGIIGFFVNSLVLRTDLSGDPTFRQVLTRVRDVTLEAMAHQDLPFERLVEELSPGRDLSHNPLFQVMFSLQHTASAPASPNSEQQYSPGPSKFDLTVNANQTAEGLTCVFEFNAALFRLETIVSLAEAYGVLLESAAAMPDLPISQLPLISAEQRVRLIEGAATSGSSPRALTVHGFFEWQVDRTPTATAVECGEQTYTYAELDMRANQLARALRRSGIGPETVIGLCIDQTPEFPIAVLGILKAGAAFLPMDHTYPRERLAYMLANAGVQILLTRSRLSDTLPPFVGSVWCLDEIMPDLEQELAEPLPPIATPDNLAYVIFTSGSTGKSKGVMVQHRGACNAAQAQIEAFALPAGTRVLQFGSLSFDISIYDLLMVFGCGGTLCLAPSEAKLPGPPLLKVLRDLRINAITLPPSTLSVVPSDDLPDLHTIVCGGEFLSGEVADCWGPNRRLFNAYGPTEASIWSTCFECPSTEVNPPIGRAIANTQAYILDHALQPLPSGFPGEIYLGGASVARGYFAEPALTADRYVPNPCGGVAGDRLYRTGDRARLLPGGAIQFLSRLDDQLKLRGYRIEIGEIETVLLSHPDVGEAAVVVQHSRDGDPRLAAFCTLKAADQKSGSADREALLRFLRDRLPEFMIPAKLGILDNLPVSGSGKLDRKTLTALAVPDQDQSDDASAGTPIEQALGRIYSEILEVRRVRPQDSFFDLGGHSLLATRAVTRINETFQIALQLRELFEFPVVADLARAVERAQAAGPAAAPPVITRAPRQALARSMER